MIAIGFALLVYVLLLMVMAIEPNHSQLSQFELRRRYKMDEQAVIVDKLRHQHYEDIAALLKIVVSLLLVVFVLLSVAGLGWLLGVLVAVLGVLEYVALSRLPWLRKRSQALYDAHEQAVLTWLQRHVRIIAIFRGFASQPVKPVPLGSRDELMHIVEQAKDILPADERRLIMSNMTFADKIVTDYMTPRSVINAVQSTDVLGPLLLDELHKTGHSRFPVIDGDIDHVVGVLYLRDVIAIDSNQATKTAADMMKTPVYYIKETQTLGHALAAFLRVKHHLFVVVNEYRETVGVITLEDAIEQMIGRKIIDEFDAHEDLRAVAARNPRRNNTPTSAKTV